ncbi:hypothetical protein ACGFI9_11105 [Micromonospora sp. NPDC048930]|uniref:hypothetical protein n=1 Tax=Micromonospora sp. NPDC048930 TaxID=3364261 RepID=UPI00371488D5
MTETRPRPRHRPASRGWRLLRTVGAVILLSLPAILFLDVFVVLVSVALLVGTASTLALRMLGPADRPPRRGPVAALSGRDRPAGGGR